jgi:hypothetical protein
MTDDIVAELDRWLAHSGAKRWDAEERMVLRARDEIVALRDAVERQKFVLSKGHAEIRAAALEEAARACEGSGAIVAEARLCAVAIRLLKDKS